MYNQTTTHHLLTNVLIAAALAVISSLYFGPTPTEAQCNSDDATAPCFAQNQDILGGQRHLLRNDDLVVDLPHEVNAYTGIAVKNYLLKTTNGAVASETIAPVVTANCYIFPP